MTQKRQELISKNYVKSGEWKPNAGVRHWCHHTVTRTVSCQVQNGSETVVQRVYQSCRWPGPCANLVSYRTLIRPTYRVSYRTVTALEWRCCPGFTGSNCDEDLRPRPDEEHKLRVYSVQHLLLLSDSVASLMRFWAL
ncbi:hypothetical protein CB1_000518015 [Camelus ferus]|nr:hypothetical protein CB1_000518015 [Camelus ferus]